MGRNPKKSRLVTLPNSVEWTFKDWCKNSLAQAGLPPKPEVSQTQSESDEEEPEEREAYDFTGEREAYDFTELEEWTFRDLRNSLAQARCPPEPEVSQSQREPAREPDEREPIGEETPEFTKLEAVLQDLKNSIAQMNQRLEPKAKTSTKEETIHNNAVSTSEPQCNEVTIGTCEHPCQLPQEQGGTSDHLSKNQERDAGGTESKAALEDTVQTSNANDELERRRRKVLQMYSHIVLQQTPQDSPKNATSMPPV